MNCSKCGLQTQPDQRFCRACGASLQMITQPLDESATVSELERTPAISVNDEKQGVNTTTLLGFIIMFIGVVVGIVGKKLIHEEIVTVIGALVSVAGMFLTAYPYLSPSSRQKFDSRRFSQPEVLVQPQEDKYLPQERNIEYVPSITERTTNLLENSAATRAKRKEDGESPA